MKTSRLFCYLFATLLAVCTYFYQLDSSHAPKNGDEFVYAHITRLTAESGHLLPLQSALDHMRNTKPPLLFWQGIASTHWGEAWDLWHLRYPSVIYTLLTALLVFLLAQRLAQQQSVEGRVSPLETGFTAALAYLAFFSTYRFGRPFLVNPAETFWFFLPFFTLLYRRAFAFESRLLVPLLLGVEIGIGLLYKSFALVAPVCFALAWWYLHMRDYRFKAFLLQDALKVVLSGTVALALFALWFALDPDPRAVWQEFVVGENAGKFDPHGGSYLATLLWGGSSVLALMLGYPMNSGLLFFPVAALFFVAFRRRTLLSDAEKMLWIWLFALFLVFSIPSQRSARYLLEAMPALAVLLALNWHRIPRAMHVASLLLSALALVLLTFLSWRLQAVSDDLYGISYWLLLSVTGTLILAGILVQRHTHVVVNVAALLTLLCLAAFLAPFDGPAGSFSEATQRHAQGKAVWVPCSFRAMDEGHRFLLPGADVHGYVSPPVPTLAELSSNYSLFAVQLPLNAQCEGCNIVGRRLEIRGRHNSDEIARMLRGDVFGQLFVQELLVQSPNAAPIAVPQESCR